jgi:hypothetical protein
MQVLSSTVASPYNCCTDGSTSPGSYGYPLEGGHPSTNTNVTVPQLCSIIKHNCKNVMYVVINLQLDVIVEDGEI